MIKCISQISPLGLAAALAMALSTGAGAQPDAAKKPDTTIRINLGAEPSSIDPSLMTDLGANNALQALMEGLVRLDAEGKPHPAAAESWEHSADYTAWTFRLRKNGKWQNGDPVRAQDFEYSLKRSLTPETNGEYAEIMYNLIKGGEDFYKAGGMTKGAKLAGVRSIDDYTIEYSLNYPAPFFGTFVSWGTWFPENQKVVEQDPEKWTFSPKTFVGNGPFKMTEYQSKERIETAKADTYWDKDSIFWDKVILRFIDDDNTEDAAFRTRELDVTETLGLPQVNYWKGKPELRGYPSNGTIYIQFNVSEKPFDNKLVRRAFSKAIDRKLIVEKILRRGEVPSMGFVPRGIPSADGTGDYRDKAGDLVGGQDVEEAKRLLKEAGITSPSALTGAEYLYNTRDENKQISEALQNMWRKSLGVDVKIQNAEWAVVVSRTRNNDFMSARGSWFGDYLDPLTYLELFESGNPKNGPRLNNAKYDKLIESARIEQDPLKREQFFIEAEKILVEDEAAVAPLYTNEFSYLVQADIEGLSSNFLGQKLYVRAKRVQK